MNVKDPGDRKQMTPFIIEKKYKDLAQLATRMRMQSSLAAYLRMLAMTDMRALGLVDDEGNIIDRSREPETSAEEEHASDPQPQPHDRHIAKAV